MDATKLLEQQHRDVLELFQQLEAGGRTGEKAALVGRLARAFERHATLEERFFYPLCVEVGLDGEEHVNRAYEEHALARVALHNLLATRASHPRFEARVQVLKELIQRHVQEEEARLFPRARSRLGPEQLEALAAALERRVTVEAAPATRRSPTRATPASSRRSPSSRTTRRQRG